MGARRVAVICDLREEGWPSMDLIADMLLKHLHSDHSGFIDPTRICPPMRRRFTHSGAERDTLSTGTLPASRVGESHSMILGANGAAFNADRVFNRLWDYPRLVKKRRAEFELFHLLDHSYSQLVHELPLERTVVTCHDIDTFRCILDPLGDQRGIAFRAMAKHILNGFRKAARVICDSRATRD